MRMNRNKFEDQASISLAYIRKLSLRNFLPAAMLTLGILGTVWGCRDMPKYHEISSDNIPNKVIESFRSMFPHSRILEYETAGPDNGKIYRITWVDDEQESTHYSVITADGRILESKKNLKQEGS